MVQRNQLIDSLRGFSMIVIIFTHATAYFPSDKFVSALWNWSNFAVPIFIFCSAYLFLSKSSEKPIQFFPYLKKRLQRLLVPYYIFLPFFFFVLWITSSELLSTKYVVQSLFVIGGVDINWLVLLFLYLTVLLPLFIWSQKKIPFLFWIFFVLSLGSSFYLIVERIPFSYKWIMWLPWSLMLYFTWFYVKFQNNKKVLALAFLGSVGIFVVTYLVQQHLHHSTVLMHNKYPPNLLYISFGVAVLLGLTFVANYIFSNRYLLQTVNFFSKHSYSIYFVHYLLLILFTAYMAVFNFNWLTLFLTILFTTVVLQLILIWVKKKVFSS